MLSPIKLQFTSSHFLCFHDFVSHLYFQWLTTIQNQNPLLIWQPTTLYWLYSPLLSLPSSTLKFNLIHLTHPTLLYIFINCGWLCILFSHPQLLLDPFITNPATQPPSTSLSCFSPTPILIHSNCPYHLSSWFHSFLPLPVHLWGHSSFCLHSNLHLSILWHCSLCSQEGLCHSTPHKTLFEFCWHSKWLICLSPHIIVQNFRKCCL